MSVEIIMFVPKPNPNRDKPFRELTPIEQMACEHKWDMFRIAWAEC